ncbi:MAG: WD40/YVTN/BNR-like repeat-containing protein [Gemmatimonadaceae bacterium]
MSTRLVSRTLLSMGSALTLGAPFLTSAAQSRTVEAPLPVNRPARARVTAPTLTAAVDAAHFKGLKYRMIGPARGGRVTTVAGVIQEPHSFYMGATGGGVWKTTDAGQTWIPVSDGQITVGSMGDIDVADSDANIVYVGTGSDGLRSNVSIGKGVWKSTDAGKTWTHVGLTNTGSIGGLEIHPTNPDIVFVAAIGNPFKPTPDRGLYRSRDGGRNWERVLAVTDSSGVVDVEFQPGNPNVLYASTWRAERKPWTIISGAREGGIYKSTDGGTTWRKLTNGLPNGLIGKSNIGVTPAAPNVVYWMLEAKPGSGVYRSDDAGETWQLVSTFGPMLTRPFYYTGIAVHPKDANTLWTMSEGYYKSTDGGKTWRSERTPHGDNHDLWINPNNPDIMVQSNDGGANVTLNGGRTWSTQYNQPTAEIYQIYTDNQFPYRIYGAQQDNSTLIMSSFPLSSGSPDDPMQEWTSGPGCETGPIFPHPTNPDTVYGSCKGQFSRMRMSSGQERQYWVGAQSLYGNPGKDLIYRFQRVSPMEASPHNANTLYYGSQHVHRTRDEGVTWEKISPDLTWFPPERQQFASGEPITLDVTGEEYYSTLYAIRESLLEPGVIWVGSNDGPFHVTRDNGRTWNKITPADQPPGCRVQNIEPSPHRAGSAYYAAHCYLLGDFQPYLWRTDDYGKSWTLLTPGDNGIPSDHPTRVVREDPDRPGLLYAGTEFAMFVSFDNGRRWQPFQLNLPHVPITDMKVHKKDLILSTQGRSFWILDNLTPLHQIADAIARAPAHLYTPREAIRFRYQGGFGGVESNRTNPADPQYPPTGAQIDYWFASAPGGPITLDVLDAAGRVVRSFSSETGGERAEPPAEPGMRRPEMVRVGTPAIPKHAGHNRFFWDYRLPGPWTANPNQSGRNGPLAVAGTYRVRLTSGSWSATQPLMVRADPRASTDGITLALLHEQLEHNLRTRDMVSEVNQLVAQIDGARGRLGNAGGAGADTLGKLNALRAKLVTPPIRYSKPELQAHIQYLYSMTLNADQKPGRDAVERYKVLRTELDERVKEARAILGTGGIKALDQP